MPTPGICTIISRKNKRNVYIYLDYVVLWLIFVFSALALSTLVLNAPNGVVYMNTTPEGEEVVKTTRAEKISNTDFGHETSLFRHSTLADPHHYPVMRYCLSKSVF